MQIQTERKKQKTSQIHFRDFNAIHLKRGTGFLHGRNVEIHRILIILGNIQISTVGEGNLRIKSIDGGIGPTFAAT